MSPSKHIVSESATRRQLVSAAAKRWLQRVRHYGSSGELGSLLRMLAGGLWRRGKDLAPVDAVLFRSDRYLHKTRVGLIPSYRVLPFSLPPGVEHVGDTRFVVDLDKVTTYCGFSFAPGGWHPFVEMLREYEANPDLRYEDSVLYRLYERLTPATVQEAIFDDETEPLSPLDRLPALHQVLKSLWQLDARDAARLVAQAPHAPVLDEHSRYLGPKTVRGGAAHFQRVVHLYESVRRHGYDPQRFGGGRPRGYFLVRDGEYRFVMSRGNHRIPSLRVLGITHFVATVRVHHPPVVDEGHLRRWSTDAGGPYPMPVAERLFDRMFTATGAERVAALGVR